MNIRALVLLAFASAFAWTSALAETPAEQLMKQIGSNAAYYLKPLPPTIENGSHDALLFKSGVEYFNRDLKELQRIAPDALNSDFQVKGKPFAQVIKDAQAAIAANEKLLSGVPSEAALQLMKQIGSNLASYLKPLTLPIEDRSPERHNFDSAVDYFNRDLKELQRIAPDALNSGVEIKGKPFSQLVREAQATIAANQKLLASRPDKKALRQLDSALESTHIARKWLPNDGLNRGTESLMETTFSSYRTQKEGALQADSKLAAYRAAELKDAEDNYEKPMQAFLAKLNAKRKATEDAKTAQVSAMEKNRTDEAKARNAARAQLAKEAGFAEAYQGGLRGVVEDLERDGGNLEKLKRCLIFRATDDSFFLDNLAGEFAIFSLRRHSGNRDAALSLRIALKIEGGRLYGENSELPGGEFRLLGTRRFATVTGVEQQVVVFEGAPRKGTR